MCFLPSFLPQIGAKNWAFLLGNDRAVFSCAVRCQIASEGHIYPQKGKRINLENKLHEQSEPFLH